MKKVFILVAAVILLTSCEKELQVVELQSISNVKQKSTTVSDFQAQLLGSSLKDYVPKREQNAYVVAKLLNLAARSNPNVLEEIQQATVKQFDGDYDLLVALALDKRTNGGGVQGLLLDAFEEAAVEAGIPAQQVESAMNELAMSVQKFDPLLNVYMPDWGDLSQYDDFLFVLDTKDVFDSEEHTVLSL